MEATHFNVFLLLTKFARWIPKPWSMLVPHGTLMVAVIDVFSIVLMCPMLEADCQDCPFN